MPLDLQKFLSFKKNVTKICPKLRSYVYGYFYVMTEVREIA